MPKRPVALSASPFSLPPFRFPFSVLTTLCVLEPAPARHSKSKLFLCARLLAAFRLFFEALPQSVIGQWGGDGYQLLRHRVYELYVTCVQ